MALTLITITYTPFQHGETPTQGTVVATLSQTIQNGAVVASTDPFVGYFSETGTLVDDEGDVFDVPANDDVGTLPAGSFYTFVIEQDNARVRQFEAVVSHLAPGGVVDLSTLEPVAP